MATRMPEDAAAHSVEHMTDDLHLAIQGCVESRNPATIEAMRKYLTEKKVYTIKQLIERHQSLRQAAKNEPLNFAVNDLKRLGEIGEVIEHLSDLGANDGLKAFAVKRAKIRTKQALVEKLDWLVEEANEKGIDSGSLRVAGDVQLRPETEQQRRANDDSGRYTMVPTAFSTIAESVGEGQVTFSIEDVPPIQQESDGSFPGGGVGANDDRRRSVASGGSRHSSVDVSVRFRVRLSSVELENVATMLEPEVEVEITHL